MANPLKLAMLGVLVLTLGWAATELLRDNHVLPAAPEADSPRVAAIEIALPENDDVPLEDFPTIIERPLFFADRKLPLEEKQEAAKPAAKQKTSPPDFRLSAIVIRKDQAIALLETQKNGETHQLKKGQSVSGWRLASIEEHAVVMKSGKRQHRLELLQFDEPPAQQPVAAKQQPRTRAFRSTLRDRRPRDDASREESPEPQSQPEHDAG